MVGLGWEQCHSCVVVVAWDHDDGSVCVCSWRSENLVSERIVMRDDDETTWVSPFLQLPFRPLQPQCTELGLVTFLSLLLLAFAINVFSLIRY